MHNETVNIHSHSIGALFYAILLPLHVGCSHFPTLGVFPSALISPSTIIDKAALACYCLSAITCLSLSSWFHTVQCCSKEVCDLAHCGDYVSSELRAHGRNGGDLLPESERLCIRSPSVSLALTLPQIGIVVLIVGSILPGMYYAFHDNPILQWGYMGASRLSRLSPALPTNVQPESPLQAPQPPT